MQTDYIQEQTHISYDLSKLHPAHRYQFDTAISESKSYIKEAKQNPQDEIAQKYVQEYGEAAYAAQKRDSLIAKSKHEKQGGFVTALATGLGYAGIATATFLHSIIGTASAMAFTGAVSRSNDNFLFKRSHKYFTDAIKDKKQAQRMDRDVFVMNGCDISQCVYKKETLEWASGNMYADEFDNNFGELQNQLSRKSIFSFGKKN